MVNQLLAGVHIATAAEALALGIRAGADPQTLFDVISTSAGSSWMWQNRVPHILAGDDTPLSAVNIFVKDLGIVLDQARQLTFPLPMASAAHQLFLAAAAAGHGGRDDAFVIRVWQALAGLRRLLRPGRRRRDIAVGEVVLDLLPAALGGVAEAGAAAELHLDHPVRPGQGDQFAGAAIMHQRAVQIRHHAVHAAAGLAAEQAGAVDAHALGVDREQRRQPVIVQLAQPGAHAQPAAMPAGAAGIGHQCFFQHQHRCARLHQLDRGVRC